MNYVSILEGLETHQNKSLTEAIHWSFQDADKRYPILRHFNASIDRLEENNKLSNLQNKSSKLSSKNFTRNFCNLRFRNFYFIEVPRGSKTLFFNQAPNYKVLSVN